MKRRIFLIHWNELEAEEHVYRFQDEGWNVELETKDGARAGKRILADLPDAVVIYLTRLPSHGRETAHALRSFQATRDLPIIFVDGEGEPLEKTKAKVPDAVFTSSAKLQKTLAELFKPVAA